MYKPDLPYNTAVELFTPTSYETVRGVSKPVYPEKGEVINTKFKTYGGTEIVINGVLTVVDTANVETWYRPDITSASMIKLNGKEYAVMGTPEDIEQKHQILKFKVRCVRGGA